MVVVELWLLVSDFICNLFGPTDDIKNPGSKFHNSERMLKTSVRGSGIQATGHSKLVDGT